MNKKKVKLAAIQIVAVVLIGVALAQVSCFAIITIIDGFVMKEKRHIFTGVILHTVSFLLLAFVLLFSF